MADYANLMDSKLYVKDEEGLRAFLIGLTDNPDELTADLLTRFLGIDIRCVCKDGEICFYEDPTWYPSGWEELAPYLEGFTEWENDVNERWRDYFQNGSFFRRDSLGVMFQEDLEKQSAVEHALFAMGAVYGSLCENGRIADGWLTDEADIYEKASEWAHEYVDLRDGGENISAGDFLESRLFDMNLLLLEIED